MLFVNTTSVTTQVTLPSQSRPTAQNDCSTSLTRTAANSRQGNLSTTAQGPGSHQVSQTAPTLHDLTIKVINPKCKREAKTYILHSISINNITTLKRLKEVILEQLGKSVVTFSLQFDVG